MTSNLLKQWFPTTEAPAIMCAPMFLSVNGTLAAEVTKAGGLGFVAGGWDFSPASPYLADLDAQLTTAREILAEAGTIPADRSGTLPIGVGFLTFGPTAARFAETVLPVLIKHKPAVIWLFVPQPGSTTHRDMIAALRDAAKGVEGWEPKVFVQTGTVAAAREALDDGADGIVAQGVDAGGHQWAQGSGVISLVPEIRAMIREEYSDRPIALIAAGGIAHGSSVAAALALGADGAVMGTRFLVAEEASSKQSARDAIIKSSDGGVGTVKSTLHDHIEHRYVFPAPFDGRALAGPSILDERAGVSLAENQEKLKLAVEGGDPSRDVVWAGTGVGLITEVQPAAQILQKTMAEALESIRALRNV
ncbi:2-nitropropane dioxygenase [Microdochium bolleyi]|uniref:2-nitropropane dioxygenase n=1 Tax=Microdochium bolleyi TaxID=196109 RepID=A0A136IUI4_9PEZI|nr:2-nitropropane dioxygenase [Microdochium bolleyi]